MARIAYTYLECGESVLAKLKVQIYGSKESTKKHQKTNTVHVLPLVTLLKSFASFEISTCLRTLHWCELLL